MRRGQWCIPKPPTPPKFVCPEQDVAKELINFYQKLRKMSAADLGAKLDKTPEQIRQKKHRGTDTWTLADFRAWCKALDISDPEEVGRAVLRIKELKQ